MSPSLPPSKARTRKEEVWLGCKAKSCCYTSVVIPTGKDVWRIARTLDLLPWHFLVYFEAAQPRRDAFALDCSPRRFRLALRKNPRRKAHGAQACTFLLRTRNGHHRCGLGELRPAVCRSFPSEMVGGVVCILPETGCRCRTWSLADVDIGEESAVIQERQADSEVYCGVVEQWNRGASEQGRRLDFEKYCEFLLDTYDRLAAESAASHSGRVGVQA